MPGEEGTGAARGQLQRPRLVQQFDLDDRVVVIRAEGGAGKTTLAAQWIALQPGSPTAWVTLDEAVSEQRGFWLRTFTALATAVPRLRELSSAYANGLVSADEAPSLLTAALIADRTPVVLVFDDLHHVGDEVQDQLVALMRRVPTLRLVATTRRRTRFESLVNEATLGVRVIGSSDLAFTSEELARLADDLPFEVRSDELAMLERVTHGHTLTARLALFLMRSLSAGGSHRPGFDEVSAGLASVTEGFLPAFGSDDEERLALALAFCPETDEALAIALRGAPDGWALVERFEEHGLGRSALRRGRTVFLMHALVGSALRRRAEQRLSPERIAETRATAYEMLRDLADPIDTLSLLIEGGMDGLVWPHFVRHFSELSLHRTQSLVSLLGRLPEERLAREGTTAIVLATALSEGSVVPTPRAKHLARLGLAALPAVEAQSEPLDAALVGVARLAAMRVYRHYERAAEVTDELLAPLEALAARDHGASWYAAKMQIVFTAVLAHRMDRVPALARLLEGDTHPGRAVHVNSLLAFAHAYTGDLRAARRLLRTSAEGDATAPHDSRRPVGRHLVGRLLAEALHRADAGDADGALALFPGLVEQLPILDLWSAILWTRGSIRLATGQVQEGLAEFSDALASCRGYPVSSGWAEQLKTLHGELLAASGDLGRARDTLAHRGTRPASQLARARLDLLRSEPQSALAALDAAAAEPYSAAQSAERDLLRAAVQLALGNSAFAADLAARGFSALERLDLRLPLSLIPADSLDALSTIAAMPAGMRPVGAAFRPGLVLAAPLTRREKIVLSLLATGMPLDELAAEQHVSPNTVKSQLRSIYRKLGVANRVEAVHRATLLDLFG